MTDDEFAHELHVAGDGRWWIAYGDDRTTGPVGVLAVERLTWNAADAPPIGVLLLDATAASAAAYRTMLVACAQFAREVDFTDVRAYCMDRDVQLQELLATLDGWREVELEIYVGLDLTKDGPTPRALPAGVRITTLAESPHLARSMHACQDAAVADVPGDSAHVTPDFDAWLAEQDAPTLPPDAAFLAVETGADGEDRVLGFTQLEVSSARPDIVSHNYTIVHPDARGRGIAYAVKLASIEWARMRGYRELRTDNEERNAPMRHINAQLGYERVATCAIWRGPVAALDT